MPEKVYVPTEKSLSKRGSESNEVVQEEIPQSDKPDGKNFRQIEIPFQSVVENVDEQVVQQQANRRDKDERSVFPGYLIGNAAESPDPVPYIVVGGRYDKAYRIGNILVEPDFLLTDPGKAEIDDHAGESDHAEFDKFEKKGRKFHVPSGAFNK